MADVLPVLFALTLTFAIGMYATTDGFDLGIGILFRWAPGDAERDAMMHSVAPVWDGNETWLVLGGTLLIAAFPVVYAVVLPAFYVPIFIMLFALIFRGLAFEYRFRATRTRVLWDWAFSGGSIVAGFMQGMMLGAFIEGVPMAAGRFSGTPLSFLSGFAIACGAGLLAGYALLGSTWLIYKTKGTTQAFARRAAPWALVAVLAFITLVSIWTLLTHPDIAERWLSWPDGLYLSAVPIAIGLLALGLWRLIPGPHDGRPFLLTIGVFLVTFLGLGISFWPYAIPPRVTIWQAASSPPTLMFLGVGIAIILPLILAYLGYAYWVFRGKVPRATGHRETGYGD